MLEHKLIPVDENDTILKNHPPLTKYAAHNTETSTLHRAFSVCLLSKCGENMLLQKRASEKITFPSLWTNTCCSHPHLNEIEADGISGVKIAAVKRLKFEMGLELEPDDLDYKCKVLYRAKMDKKFDENEVLESAPNWEEFEMDYILFGIIPDAYDFESFNREEVSEVSVASFREIFCMEDKVLSPWFKEMRNRGLLEAMWKSDAFKVDTGSRIIDFYNYDKQDFSNIDAGLLEKHGISEKVHTTHYFVRYLPGEATDKFLNLTR